MQQTTGLIPPLKPNIHNILEPQFWTCFEHVILCVKHSLLPRQSIMDIFLRGQINVSRPVTIKSIQKKIDANYFIGASWQITTKNKLITDFL